MKISIKALMELAVIVHRHSGIVLKKNKAYLVENRLQILLEECSLSCFEDLIAEAARSPQLTSRIVDLMTTNETSFFRDTRPYLLLKEKLLPDWQVSAGQKPGRLKIWSCACSTGQEVYSIAITLMEYFKDKLFHHDIKIRASDISDSAIVKASRGRYSNYEVSRGLTTDQLEKYFTREETHWAIKDELRGMAYFEKMNLLQPEMEYGRFDIIFCRNVAIYFSKADRQTLFRNLSASLKDDGVLIIGATESLFDINEQLKRMEYKGSAYYRNQ